MFVSDFAVNRRTTVFVFLVLIAVGGTVSYIMLPREADPEIVIPFVTITASYPGVSPEDVESLVTNPIERKLSGLASVKEITSTSLEGISAITIEFDPDIDIDDALQRVGDKVDLAIGELPPDAERPVIREVNTAERPVIYVSVMGSRPLHELTTIAEDLEDRLEAIPGVLDVAVLGGLTREIQVEVNPDRLAQYGIPLPALTQALVSENINTPAGTLDVGAAKYLTRVPGEFQALPEIAGLVVKHGGEGAVYVRNVAAVRDGFEEMLTISRVNGVPSVTLTVSKRSGVNIISVSDAVRRVLADTQNGLPEGVSIRVVMDKSTEIADMVTQLESGILSGLVLVLVVVFIYMGLTNSILVSLAIPLSLLITFVVLALSGITLNMVVLFSLTLCLGILVDNAIVVVENIHRYRQTGMSLELAAKQGAGEIAVPIIVSTFTTLAAFAPLFFWPGVMGSYMLYLPQTATIALLASLAVGLIIVPALVSVVPGLNRATGSGQSRRHTLSLDAYTWILRASLRRRGVVLFAILMSFLTVTTVYFAGAEIEFMPRTEPVSADINIERAEGTSLAASDEVVRVVEAAARPYFPAIEYIVANVGSSSGERAGQAQTHRSQVTLRFPPTPNDFMLPSLVLAELRDQLTDLVGADIHIEQEQYGPPKGAAISIELRGNDYKILSALSDDIRQRIQNVDGLVDLDDDLERGKPEVRVAVDREKARRSGLSTQDVGLAVKTAVEGFQVGQFREGTEEYDIVVRFPKRFSEDVKHLESMMLINAAGDAIPIFSVARIERGAGMGSIRHVDRERTVTITADAKGRPGAEVLSEVKARLRNFDLPPGYTFAFAGEDEDRNLTQSFLILAFFIGLLLISLILVTEFNSILQPLVIMSSVVLSLAGVFLGLLLFDMPFGIFMTGLGCISLAGIVVNNAIVLLDFVNRERAAGKPLEDALIEAGRTRFRPVLLTAVTTILGLFPMAMGVSFNFRTFTWIIGGASNQFWGPMAVSIIFGLSFATVLTLVVIPVLYSVGASMFMRRTHASKSTASTSPMPDFSTSA